MFIKVFSKSKKSTGDQSLYYRLCESYRIDTSVRHNTILYLGNLDELSSSEQKNKLCKRIESLVKESRTGIKDLFDFENDIVEILAQKFFLEIKQKKRLDLDLNSNNQTVKLDTLENKNIRELGSEWLCAQALEQLKLKQLLLTKNWTEKEINLALTHIISRACYPASELRTSQWIKQNSAVCEITQYDENLVTKDKLYGISKKLYSVKDGLEKHLSTKTNELFDLDDNIIIYDLTNSYFEGKLSKSKLANYGRSKEKRKDCKLIVLALVVNVEGFIKYSHLFEGSMSDSKSLEKLITQLSERTSSIDRKPTIVMDAGIASEDNIQLLKKYNFNYMCVSRSALTKYSVDSNNKPIIITDNKGQTIQLQKVKKEKGTDNYLLVHSHAKQAKEESMRTKFSTKYEEEIKKINDSLTKKSGIKTSQKVYERIGRLKQKYPSINKHYTIDVTINELEIVTAVTGSKTELPKQEGKYLLRTNLDEKTEAVQWKIYNTIREIESTFRCLKTDLDLRPIYHKTDDACMAHLHLGLLAYTTVNTIRHQLKVKGINNEWRDVVRIMNTQKAVSTTLENQYEQTIIIRQCSEPSQQVKTIYDALNYKYKPFSRKKFVVPKKPPDLN